MDFDDIQRRQFDAFKQEWIRLCSTSSKGICDLANRYRKRDDCLLRSMHSGSFNFSLRLHWEDGGEDWLIRFPLPGKSMFLDEKVRREAVLMEFVGSRTEIPVPRVIAYGAAHENPTGLGPFIIMTWIEGRKMSEILRKDTPGKEDILKPDIDSRILGLLYSQMAEILLELWKLDFDCIVKTNKVGSIWLTAPPLTLEVNELMRTCGLGNRTPSGVYHSSTDYIASLLQLQSTHLREQRNSVYDSEDCREKYACRQLMKAIAFDFISHEDNHGPFKLFCDDFGPSNVLVDDSLRVTGVIDWEFCYTAPVEFAGSIPSWLLLQRPHRIINELDAARFLDMFLPKAEIFLNCLQQKEGTNGANPEYRLSARMQKSIEDKSAWFILAARMVSSVDMIYWELLDEFCWGPRLSIAERIRNVTTIPEKHKERERFVRLKIRHLPEYYTELGEETTVEYEEEGLTKREETFDHWTRCAKSSTSRPVTALGTGSHVYLPLCIGLFSLGCVVGLLAKRIIVR
ncbi:uncharacterized protein NFIA_027550 [Aspergillus fischeri NRRL 181]|uniref:Aminoglycoside phosphotransferase domain-containing protein n=1 Tax=Neosartorya fischeri (strain ATCC 1020 / DSM 3700 / CBS 544.65 / FGSC A1164 / JCM 1740 / NRRL 181 / WB 181) TaxID=331117 RepID=A1DCX1_NEOFI|nr:uncharacterized protein NFIA_027550 [Aspergillus fischeri NRRL 181]EAW19681.1 hypothetical protein NFIA_027550 [Aspergillus fischeri NRRL 181]